VPSLTRLNPFLPWLALAVSVLAVGAFDSSFLRPGTLVGLMADNATLLAMAIGLTFVILIGSIDLSMQSVAALASIVLARELPARGLAAGLEALVAGAAVGALSGFVHGRLRIPSFVATLSVGGIAATAAFWLSGQRAVGIPGDIRAHYLGWLIGDAFGAPEVLWLVLSMLALAAALERLTPLGRMLRAVGCSEPAASVSGLSVIGVKIAAFTICGLFAALSGVMLAARLSSGTPTIANEFLLPAVAAVVLGGTSLSGGSGGVIRTFAGAMLIAVFRAGMTFLEINALAQQIVFGAILIGAVGLNAPRQPKNVTK
jgi:ribose transport system permease protein